MKFEHTLVVSCNYVIYELDRTAACESSRWFANRLSQDAEGDIGSSSKPLIIPDVPTNLFEHLVVFLNKDEYPAGTPYSSLLNDASSTGAFSDDTDTTTDLTGQPLLQHTRIYALALRFEMPHLKSLAAAAFEEEIENATSMTLEPYLECLAIIFNGSDFDEVIDEVRGEIKQEVEAKEKEIDVKEEEIDVKEEQVEVKQEEAEIKEEVKGEVKEEDDQERGALQSCNKTLKEVAITGVISLLRYFVYNRNFKDLCHSNDEFRLLLLDTVTKTPEAQALLVGYMTRALIDHEGSRELFISNPALVVKGLIHLAEEMPDPPHRYSPVIRKGDGTGNLIYTGSEWIRRTIEP